MITHEANSFSNILVNLRDLRGELRNSAREIEEHRRIPLNIIERLRDIGIFGMCFPQSWGGAGLTSIEQILVLEELARGDTATAWCAMIGCDSGIYSGFLEEKSAKEIFPHANLAVAGWIHPQGKAEIVDGGYIVTGKWRFASGSPHGDVISAGCFLYRNGNLILDDNGKPLWRVMLARPADYLFPIPGSPPACGEAAVRTTPRKNCSFPNSTRSISRHQNVKGHCTKRRMQFYAKWPVSRWGLREPVWTISTTSPTTAQTESMM